MTEDEIKHLLSLEGIPHELQKRLEKAMVGIVWRDYYHSANRATQVRLHGYVYALASLAGIDNEREAMQRLAKHFPDYAYAPDGFIEAASDRLNELLGRDDIDLSIPF
jgi:hypothetical protein